MARYYLLILLGLLVVATVGCEKDSGPTSPSPPDTVEGSYNTTLNNYNFLNSNQTQDQNQNQTTNVDIDFEWSNRLDLWVENNSNLRVSHNAPTVDRDDPMVECGSWQRGRVDEKNVFFLTCNRAPSTTSEWNVRWDGNKSCSIPSEVVGFDTCEDKDELLSASAEDGEKLILTFSKRPIPISVETRGYYSWVN